MSIRCNFGQARPLCVHTVATRLGVSRRTVRFWAQTGVIPAWKDGPRLWKFRAADIDEFARTGGTGVLRGVISRLSV